MALTYDNASNGTGNVATSISWSHTCSGTDRLLVVGIHVGSGQGYNVTNVTYAGVSMTNLGVFDNSNGQVGLWYLINPATGANTVATTKSTSGYHRGGSVSYTGASQISQPNVHGSSSAASGTTFSHTLTTTVDQAIMIAIVVGNVISAGASTTVRSAPDGSVKIFDSNGNRSVGSNALNFSGSNSVWTSYMAGISPVPIILGGSPIFFGNTAIA